MDDPDVFSRLVIRAHPERDYEVDYKAKLGVGAFASVYRGVDRRTGRLVALKFSHPQLKRDAMQAARQEAVQMQRVSRATVF